MKRGAFSTTWRVLAAAIGIVCAMPATASITGITVDGNLSDWGVSAPLWLDGNDWTPDSDVLAWMSEDGQIGPGVGGQAFDLEAMYLYLSGNTFYFAMVTGMGPYGAMGVLPGDIFFDVGADGSYDLAVMSIYRGYGAPAGSVWTGTGDWYYLPTDFPASAPYAVDRHDASWAGMTNAYAYNATAYGYAHWVVEFSVDLPADVLAALLESGTPLSVHWTQGCGNDVGELTWAGGKTVVPEPTSFLLLGIGIAGIIVRRRFVK
ncbi:MAG: PEP-CTERM sorting domain-containing protein [Candidatus Hydrogenedentes bacterium]|nr:PEP-CTERM sorting domain-containing protein [Candidatus Hydrogenedentota bacterium]